MGLDPAFISRLVDGGPLLGGGRTPDRIGMISDVHTVWGQAEACKGTYVHYQACEIRSLTL